MTLANILEAEEDPTLVPDSRGLGPLLLEKMKEHGKKVAQIDAATGYKQTYDDMLLKSIRVAQNMQTMGITSKDILTMCLPNLLDSSLPYLAALYLQIKVACLDPTLSVKECAHLLGLVKPTYVFCNTESINLMESAIKVARLNSTLIVFGETTKHVPFSKFLISTGREDTFVAKPVKDLFETAVIFFSSGSTGLPKGIRATHYGLISQQLLFMKGHDMSVALYFTSMYWISAISVLISSIIQGTSRLLCLKFNAETTLQLIEKYRVTYVFMSPYLITQIIQNSELVRYDTSTLKSAIVGGGKIIQEHLSVLKRILPHTVICHAYGLTEIHGIATYLNPEDDKKLIERKPTNVGKPCPGHSYKVVDLDTNVVLGPYKEGEIRFKTKCLTTGYYNNPKETADAWDDDGYFKTGDIGYYDDEHCFYIVDRIKDAMKYQAWHVVPAEIEGVLLTHPDVKEAAVFGKPHPIDGEHPTAAVVLENDTRITEKELLQFVNDLVPERQKLRGGVTFVEKLPYTPTGKIQRRKLRDLLLK